MTILNRGKGTIFLMKAYRRLSFVNKIMLWLTVALVINGWVANILTALKG